MLKPLLFLLFINVAFGQKIALDERRKQILSIVDEELSEVSRLARQQDYGSPDTLLRVSELNLEKARLWRESENEQFLSIPPEERRNLKKSEYFKKSNQYFEAANDSALLVIKKFPKYKDIGEIYYILAYNNKELGKNEEAQKYFKLSTQNAAPNTPISYKSKLALADYYFNAHKFKEAIPLYEASLNKVDERWWTKDAFNLAWSYYRTKNTNRAIDLMKEIHRKSGNEKYINMRSMVERDIGIFFIDAGRMNDAVKFYEGLGLNYTEQFVRVAQAITTQGRFAQAEELLNQAAKYEKDRDRKVEIMMAQLDLFDKYGKIPAHLEVCQQLVKMNQERPLSEDDLKRLTYHVNKKAAELQKSTASETYKDVPTVRQQKAQASIAYFELSSQLNPGQKAEKTFYQAETAYVAGNYSKALSFYVKAHDEAKANRDSKIITQSLEGMLASLGQSSLDKKVAEKSYIPVYTRYLAHDSHSERASSIYVKLFNAQFDEGDYPSAEKTMAEFSKNFPKDYKTQEGMLAKVMEHYRNKKDYGKVKEYVTKINEGEFKVSKKYADALKSLMTKIQIEGVQKSLENGQKGVALKGYHQIYESAESTPKAKVNAAYNLSALYYELGDSNQSYRWGVTALKDMEVDDVVKFTESFLSISAGLFLRQHFTQSADFSYRVLAKLCKQNSANKAIAYKNAVLIALSNGELDKALEIRNFGKNCLIPDNTISEVSFELLKDLARAKKWEAHEDIVTELEKNSKNWPNLIKPLEDLRLVYISLGDSGRAKELAQKQERYFNEAKAQKLDVPVEALDLMAQKLLASVYDRKKKMEQIQLNFPENDFNNAVKAKLQLLDQMTTQVNAIQKTGSGTGIVEAYRQVIESYESFGESLKSFTPPGKSPEYVASFSKAMSEVYNPILANARKQRSEIKKLIMENKILTQANYAALYSMTESFKRYVPVKEVVLMDRGGKR